MPLFRRHRAPDLTPSEAVDAFIDDARHGRIAVTPCFLPWDETPEEQERLRRRIQELIAKHSEPGPDR